MVRNFAPDGLVSFYADESDDKVIYVISSVCVPTIGRTGDGYAVEWDDYVENARRWHSTLCRTFALNERKELKGAKLATGHNDYLDGGGRLHGERALEVYREALVGLTFLPPGSVFSVAATRDVAVNGQRKLGAALSALFSHMQRDCGVARQALVFCDEGHDEYRQIFRSARTQAVADAGFPSAIKDLNFKDSRESLFIQIADLVSYACLARLREETGIAAASRTTRLHRLIPTAQLSTSAGTSPDGILRLGFEKQNGSAEGAIS